VGAVTTRRLSFFALPAEFDRDVWSDVCSRHLLVAPFNGGRPGPEIQAESFPTSGDFGPQRFLIIQPGPEHGGDPGRPARRSMVDVLLPVQDAEALFLGEIWCSSSHLDADSVLRDDPATLTFFSSLTRRLRSHIQRPTWGWHIQDVENSRAYRTIAYTDGAREWWERGGALRQSDVPNVAFGTRPPRD
jgi:hypothetical protein